jgi:hypothetical protein
VVVLAVYVFIRNLCALPTNFLRGGRGAEKLHDGEARNGYFLILAIL